MAQSVIKSVSQDLSGSVFFKQSLTNYYKNVRAINKMLFINVECYMLINDIPINEWVEIGNITLPNGMTLMNGQVLNCTITNANYVRTGFATLRVENNKLHLWINNRDGAYLFINGFVTIN